MTNFVFSMVLTDSTFNISICQGICIRIMTKSWVFSLYTHRVWPEWLMLDRTFHYGCEHFSLLNNPRMRYQNLYNKLFTVYVFWHLLPSSPFLRRIHKFFHDMICFMYMYSNQGSHFCDHLWRVAVSLGIPLQWRYNDSDGVSNHQPHDCLLNRLFKVQVKENIKASRHLPLRGEFTGDRWIPRQLREKSFHLMMSSCANNHLD